MTPLGSALQQLEWPSGGQLQGSELPLGTPQDEVGPPEATFIRQHQLPVSKDLGWFSRSLPRPLHHAPLIAPQSAAWPPGCQDTGLWLRSLSPCLSCLGAPLLTLSKPSLPAFSSLFPENSQAPWLPGIPPLDAQLLKLLPCVSLPWAGFSSHLSENSACCFS